MVVGLEKFKEHFADYASCYILIGGAACSVAMEHEGLEFRSTKDLDIVLCIEVLDAAFGKAFWEFVEAGGYKNQQKSTGKAIFYRFHTPQNSDYPVMLELFSRKPDLLPERAGATLTPIPVGEEVSSLSAILLHVGYYEYIHSRKTTIEGISMVGIDCLIALKAKAYLDLMARSRQGHQVDSKDIRKHRNDVFRLVQIISPDLRAELPDAIKSDVREFVAAVEKEAFDVNSFLKGSALTKDVYLNRIRQVYAL